MIEFDADDVEEARWRGRRSLARYDGSLVRTSAGTDLAVQEAERQYAKIQKSGNYDQEEWDTDHHTIITVW